MFAAPETLQRDAFLIILQPPATATQVRDNSE